jgi:hypothetical protein
MERRPVANLRGIDPHNHHRSRYRSSWRSQGITDVGTGRTRSSSPAPRS